MLKFFDKPVSKFDFRSQLKYDQTWTSGGQPYSDTSP